MTATASRTQGEGVYIHVNGADIHYVESGQGEPLLLLHGGMVSTSAVWTGVPVAYVSHMATFAEHFRVIAPDTRGHGRTVNPGGGSISHALLADDVVALIDALGLDRPLLCGFSDGAMTATVVAIRHPERIRALVNHAGYDVFNPQSPTFRMGRQVFGGSPDATRADPDAVEQFFTSSDEMSTMFALMKADHDAAQGPGYWKTLMAETFDRFTTSPGYTVEDLRSITAPTLILTGDRDHFCSVEEGVAAYRMLQHGALAILPNSGHIITPTAVQVAIAFMLECSDGKGTIDAA